MLRYCLNLCIENYVYRHTVCLFVYVWLHRGHAHYVMTLQLHHNICTDLLNLCHDRQIRDTFNCVECLVLIHRGPHG
jgi:hypothetical protein